MPQPCPIPGHPDMYGLGLRISFYLLWYGAILATLQRPSHSEAPILRFARLAFSFGIFVALVVQTAGSSPQPAETYIVLLLAYGHYYALVPLTLWRLLTCCDPRLDPSRYPAVAPGPVFLALHAAHLLALTSFSLWFWAARAPGSNRPACEQYGFFFDAVPLSDDGFVAFHIRRLLRRLTAFVETATATVLVVAVELTIGYNNIAGVDDAGSAAQLVPLVLAAALVLRVLWRWVVVVEVVEDDERGFRTNYSWSSSSWSGGGGGGGGGRHKGRRYWRGPPPRMGGLGSPERAYVRRR
ncbi:hypothetical protein BDY21DRAFT_293479 [Lineolata rhizophorae]|uniref:Uncharacterized protein n=1 Tax=Lineolata rhizophorae TaxID=578093 RepID=A0A6A6NNC4_9PEZI|nr:hypothetical protein BDY21DRAFT_293479 [Lineolata rhizophorae]